MSTANDESPTVSVPTGTSNDEILTALAGLHEEFRSFMDMIDVRLTVLEQVREEIHNAFLVGVDAGAFGLVAPSMSKEDAQRVPPPRRPEASV